MTIGKNDYIDCFAVIKRTGLTMKEVDLKPGGKDI